MMTTAFKTCIAAICLAFVAGCTTGTTSHGRIEVTQPMFSANIGLTREAVQTWRVASVEVVVPAELNVSTDPRAQFPREKIVWWGEAAGDRRAQVDDIMTKAIARGASILQGNRPVRIEAVVKLFHAVTPQARNSRYFAWHDISLAVVVRDARTGEVLASETDMNADLIALRNEEAKLAEAAGETQRVRISRRVAGVFQAWLNSGVAAAAE